MTKDVFNNLDAFEDNIKNAENVIKKFFKIISKPLKPIIEKIKNFFEEADEEEGYKLNVKKLPF